MSVAIALAAMFAACGEPAAPPPPAEPPGPTAEEMAAAKKHDEAVARGKYLVDHVSACIECHTPRAADGSLDMSRYLAGADCFLDIDPKDDKVGCNSPRNLTNHETGLKSRSDDQIKAMFLDGKRPDGTFLNGFMPYWVYHNMTAEDADAIVAYLRTVPGIDHTVPPNQPPFDNVPGPVPPLDPEKDIPKPMTVNDSTTHGRYLAAMAGVCIECHTPHMPPGPGPMLQLDKPFAGGEAFGAAWLDLPSPPLPEMIYTRNLTSDATGLQGWTVEDVAKVLHHGKDREGKGICPPMPVGPMFAYGGITEADVRDIAAYVLALPPVASKNGPDCTFDPPPPPAAGGADGAPAPKDAPPPPG